MLAIIDSDSLCYALAFAQEKDGELKPDAEKWLYHGLDKAINSIIEDTKATDYKVYLSGKTNFRNDVSPLYKANRADMRRPILLPQAREYLEVIHNAIIRPNMEADDAVCIEQTYCIANDIPCVLAHIDKDIDQQVGLHYKWPLRGNDAVLYEVTKEQGLYNLYVQALEGDKVDNIMYYLADTGTWKKNYGLGKKGAREALEGLTTEKELYLTVLDYYRNSEKFIRKDNGEQATEEDLAINMQLLYMKRTDDDCWEKP